MRALLVGLVVACGSTPPPQRQPPTPDPAPSGGSATWTGEPNVDEAELKRLRVRPYEYRLEIGRLHLRLATADGCDQLEGDAGAFCRGQPEHIKDADLRAFLDRRYSDIRDPELRAAALMRCPELRRPDMRAACDKQQTVIERDQGR